MTARPSRLAPDALEAREVPTIDLLATSLTVEPTTARVGDVVTLRFVIQNIGDTPAPAFDVGVYASTVPSLTTADEQLARLIIPGLAPGQSTGLLSGADIVPADTPPGAYTLGLIVDPDSAVPDGNRVNNSNRGIGIDQVAFTVTANAPGDSTPADRVSVVGPGAGGGGTVVVTDPGTGAVVSQIQPFEPSFTGGVRTATGDVDGNGGTDVVAVPGPGRAPAVLVFDAQTGARVRSVESFEATFLGGLFAATGDFDRDGFADIVITPDEGGGPRVLIVSGRDSSVLANFYGIDDPNFRGGARAAVGDLNGDGTPDLLVAAGFGGGPRVAFFDGRTLRPGVTPARLTNDIFVFEQTLRNGVYVGAGDLNGDGFADPVFGGGPGGGPRVYAISGGDLVLSGSTARRLANFFGGDSSTRAGIRVSVKDVDGDRFGDLVVGLGTGATVTAYAGLNLPADGVPTVLSVYDTFGGAPGGVFVG